MMLEPCTTNMPETWTAFLAQMRAAGRPSSTADQKAVLKGVWDYMRRCHNYRNDAYHVAVDRETEHGFEGMVMWHLSIKRHDRQPIHDWRELQAIKSAICGPEVEAIELYPAESRVMDTANQYHLYAFMQTKRGEYAPALPCGIFAGRFRDQVGMFKSVNRPFNETCSHAGYTNKCDPTGVERPFCETCDTFIDL